MRLIAAATALAALTGCLDARHGVVAGEVGGDTAGGAQRDVDVAAGATDTLAADTLAADTLAADTRTVDTAPPCAAPVIAVENGVVPAAIPLWHVVALTRERVVFGADPRELGPIDVIYGVTPPGEPHGTGDSSRDDVLLDGRDGARLQVQVLQDGTGRQGLTYRSSLHTATLSPYPNLERIWELEAAEAPPHLVVHERAAWRSYAPDAATGCERRWLNAWEGPTTEVPDRVWEGTCADAYPTAPWVDDLGVAWAEPHGAGWRVRSWADGVTRTEREIDGPVEQLVRVAGGFLWTSPTGLWRATGDGAPSQRFAGPCRGLDSDGIVAVALCEGDGTVMAPHSGLWLFDGGVPRMAPTPGPAKLLARVDGGLVAWLEPFGAADGCAPTPTRASVLVAPTFDLGLATVVGTVAAACGNGPQPPRQLSLHDGLVAWGYAGSPLAGDDTPAVQRLGWARVRLLCE